MEKKLGNGVDGEGKKLGNSVDGEGVDGNGVDGVGVEADSLLGDNFFSHGVHEGPGGSNDTTLASTLGRFCQACRAFSSVAAFKLSFTNKNTRRFKNCRGCPKQ